jgi:RNA polymerase sigma factor (sigma-70 family)
LISTESVKSAVITQREENQLIDRILAGEERCYAELVDQYKRYAFTIALKVVGDRAEAEEVAQDSFIKAYHYLKGFNREARFSTWLYRIVFNSAISHKRKKKIHFEDVQDVKVEYSERADAGAELKDKQMFVSQALSKLNEADQLAIQLFYIREFSLEEVAEMMGQNVNTVKVRIHRARQRLADELKRILKQEALTL